ncbi:hypothetical protein BgAZ_107930 [Babesia gibsoni]|uniref:Uncharacterized protein n=1 Tax=Babesia gibsoni TaxID=33632 RepID=A0AAD8PGK3_BABGI|nr:hypothetical protein BgAZ_107930 [Babesia gibsoni]
MPPGDSPDISIMAKDNSKDREEVSSASGSKTSKNVAPQDKINNDACKDSQKNKKKKVPRKNETDDQTSIDFRKTADTPSAKRNNNQSKRITEYFPLSDINKFKDDGDDGVDIPATIINSTLLDEALYADDIAKDQVDLQDLDILSLSQSQGPSRVATTDEDDDRKRKKKRFPRLQDTMVKLMSKAKQDLEHLDEKIKVLEEQYFAQPSDTTGLIKGWECSLVGSAAYSSLNNKTRKGVPTKTKQVNTQAQAVITEHIFSLTSSTCEISNSLLNKTT